MTAYVLATANKDKVAEIRAILEGVELVERPATVPDVEETGDTLVENARLKATALVEATAMSAIADDTGLEVDALGGRPGVHSSRYAGENAGYEDNQLKLLVELGDQEDRKARFRTIALMRRPDGTEVCAEGVVEGLISLGRRGHGWGYDPIFVPFEGDGRTFAEMTAAEKNAISHRGRAFRTLADKMTGANSPS